MSTFSSTLLHNKVLYDGIDPEHSELFKMVVITKSHHDEEYPDGLYIEAYDCYALVTRYFDQNGFEVRREVQESFSLDDLLNSPVSQVITRENGLIRKKNKTYFDTGFIYLPNFDSLLSGDLFLITPSFLDRNTSPHNEYQYLVRSNVSIQPIEAKGYFSRDDVFNRFYKGIVTSKELGFLMDDDTLNSKKETLEKAIQEQTKRVIHDLENQVYDLTIENKQLKNDLLDYKGTHK